MFVLLISFSLYFARNLIWVFISPERAQSCANRGAWKMNALNPNLVTAAERLDEVAEMLAASLQRVHARQSSAQSADRGEGSLDCVGNQSGHANVLTDGGRK